MALLAFPQEANETAHQTARRSFMMIHPRYTSVQHRNNGHRTALSLVLALTLLAGHLLFLPALGAANGHSPRLNRNVVAAPEQSETVPVLTLSRDTGAIGNERFISLRTQAKGPEQPVTRYRPAPVQLSHDSKTARRFPEPLMFAAALAGCFVYIAWNVGRQR